MPSVPSARYPDPAIQSLDPAFDKYRIAQSSIERIASGCRWNEGPVYFGDARCLLWSDIPNNRIMRWDEETGAVSVYRKPANLANGNTRDREGRLITCEHGARRVTRTEYDGTVTVLMDKFEGKPLNSPNDIVVKSDGSIWFTDPFTPTAGTDEDRVVTPQLPHNVYRLDPGSGAATVVAAGDYRPNGIAFSPDESLCYIVNSSATPREILVYDVTDGGTRLANRRVFVTCLPGEVPDGYRVDTDGNLWCGWGIGVQRDGVKVFDKTGKPIGFIALPERAANLCFGGPRRNRLFVAASHSIYALSVNAQGVKGG
ncbi:MAG: SMP-30/gluconolactonase/LRE family protein [Alphaproteobacteria bacterium]|nr:SMP-30/gluconolactonase/LRE family protein [Alphaproteobacteria bacterium]